MTSWAATYTPAKQPAGTKDEWEYLDASTYDGFWRDVIEDVNGDTWHRVRRYIEADPPWHPINLPGHKAETFSVESLKTSVRRHQLGDFHGILLQVETVAAMVKEIENLRALVSKMQDCIVETLESAEEACDV